MAEYLPIRAFNRSQNVRIEKTKILPTASTFIDISNGVTRKEFSYHSAIGSVYVTGSVHASNLAVVVYGLVASGEETKKVLVAAGAYKTLSTGVVTVVAAAEPTFKKPTVNNIIDLVELKVEDGTIKVAEGVEAASPVAPAADTGYIPLYTFAVAKNAEKATEGKYTDVRPF